MIKVENLSKSFGRTKAVDNLTFEVQSGEIVGLLGPNGAGKTTTMRLITGFLAPDKGTIHIGNINLEESTLEAQKQIGYLPENNPLYQDMLVAELLDLSADLSSIPASERKNALDFAVSSVGIDEYYYHPAGELSKGYQQRVGLAMVLLHKPKILIMDEPTEGLDPNQRTHVRALIKTLAKDRTIIMSTHVMQEASALCNRILIINKGKLVADGTTEELSRLSQDKTVLSLDIEGKDVVSVLKNLDGISHVEIEHERKNRTHLKIITNKRKHLQPEISRLSHKHLWTIWHLEEEKRGLEDIFREITKEGSALVTEN